MSVSDLVDSRISGVVQKDGQLMAFLVKGVFDCRQSGKKKSKYQGGGKGPLGKDEKKGDSNAPDI